jgi:hypothetical protein
MEQAIAHVNSGDLEQGRALLERVLEQDPQNDQAWVWLSGCVEGEMQRRICLQQALKANPENQAALDGMKLLEGELVQASDVPPSLLESRLSAMGMGGRPAPSSPPSTADATEVSPDAPEPSEADEAAAPPAELVEEEETAEPVARPRTGRIVLLLAVVLLLFLVVCVLVATQVVPALLETIP